MDELALVLKGYERLAIAFSGGNDSLVLAFCAQQILGAENVLLLHGHSCFVTAQERAVVGRVGLDIHVLEVDILNDADVVRNDAMRCYYCKKRLFTTFQKEAQRLGFSYLADGSNRDDLSEDRKGFIACHELKVVHPFIAANMDKHAIDKRAQIMNLNTFMHESRACLATRFQAPLPLSLGVLQAVAKIEDDLIAQGFTQVRCRVTPHGYLLQVAPQEIPRLRKLTTLQIDPLGYQRS